MIIGNKNAFAIDSSDKSQVQLVVCFVLWAMLFSPVARTQEDRLKLPHIEEMKSKLDGPTHARAERLRISELRWSQGGIRGLGDFDELTEDSVTLKDMNFYIEIEHLGFSETQVKAGRRFLADIEIVGHFFDAEGKPLGHKSLGISQLTRLKPYKTLAIGAGVKLSDALPKGRYRIDIEVIDRTRHTRDQRTIHFIH